MQKAVILVEGGVVQSVISDKDLEIVILDRDKEDTNSEDDRIKEVLDRPSYVFSLSQAEVDPMTVHRVLKETGRS